MAPEYGATIGFFPVDEESLNYLRFTGRPAETVALAEAYFKEQGLFHTESTPDPVFTDTLELDLATVVPSLAGPKRPAGPRDAQGHEGHLPEVPGGDALRGQEQGRG